MIFTVKKNISEKFPCIDTDDTIGLNYWCERFNCGEKQIRAAITIVGVSAVKVENFLRASNQIG